MRATYEGEYANWDIKMVRELIDNGDNTYTFRSEAKNLFASISETSVFEVRQGVITPLNYTYLRKIFGRKTLETIRFLNDKNTALYQKNDKKPYAHALSPGLSDPALYQLQLQIHFVGSVKELELPFIKRKKVKTYRFQRVGEEALPLGEKALSTLVVERVDEEKQTRVWLVPEWNNVIAKLEHTDEGDTYILEITEYDAEPKRLDTFIQSVRTSPSP